MKSNHFIVKNRRHVTEARDQADKQILKWSETHKQKPATGDHFQHVTSLTKNYGISKRGPLLLQDVNFLSHLSSFATERIPERVVHAKGAGAKGYFIVTNSMAKYTRASLFSKVGKRTPVVARFSTANKNLGSADTVIDLRGFAVKFKTKEGNYDLTMLNTHVFNIRNPILFPSGIHARTRNPATHLEDSTMLYDFACLRPENTFNIFLVNSDLGFFKSYSYMEGHSVNAYSWETGPTDTQKLFVRYHMLPNRKKAILSRATFEKLAGTDPDYMIRTLYNEIARKEFPSWTLYVQMFTPEDVKKAKFDLFDPTKLLPEKDFPLRKIGKLILNKNPVDYFNEVEQVKFNPGNVLGGIQLSPDRVVLGRPFVYTSTQNYRLGINSDQLPINGPARNVKSHTYRRDGFMNIYGNGDGGPNYFPNSFNGPYVDPEAASAPNPIEGGLAGYFEAKNDDNFYQIDEYWRNNMKRGERRRTVKSIAAQLAKATKAVQECSLKNNWDPINPDIKAMMRMELAKANAREERNRKKIEMEKFKPKKFNKSKTKKSNATSSVTPLSNKTVEM